MSAYDQFFQTDNDAGINQGGFASKGDLILNPAHKAAYFGAGYDGKDNIIRILPFFTMVNGVLTEVPYRGGAGFTRFSPWYKSYPAFRSIGQTGKISILVNDPTKNPSFDQNSNPICILHKEIKDAVQFGKKNQGFLPGGRRLPNNGSNQVPPYWYGILEGSQGKGAELPYLSSVVLVTALIYSHPSKKDGITGLPIGLRDDDGCVVFEITGPLWTNQIAKAINAPKPGYVAAQGQVDFEQMFLNGDPVGLRNGRFLHIFKQGTDPRAGAVMGQGPSLDMYSQQGQATAAGQAGFQAKGYDSFMSRTLPGYPEENGMSAQLSFPDDPRYQWMEQRIKERWVSLDDLIMVHSPAKQAEYVSNLFPAEMLLYAWERHPQWITADIKARGAVILAPQTPISIDSPAGNTPGYGTVMNMPGLGVTGTVGVTGNFLPPQNNGAGAPLMPGQAGAAPHYVPSAPPQQAAPMPAQMPGQMPAQAPATTPAATAPAIPTPNVLATSHDSSVAGLANPAGDFAMPAAQSGPPAYVPPANPVPTSSAPGYAPPVAPAALPQPAGLSTIDQLRQLAGKTA